MAFVYILENRSGKYYIGSTTDINRRINQHQAGYTHSTKRLGEFRLIFSQKYDSLEDARCVESRLKKLKRKDYIDKIIKSGVIKIKPR